MKIADIRKLSTAELTTESTKLREEIAELKASEKVDAELEAQGRFVIHQPVHVAADPQVERDVLGGGQQFGVVAAR